MRLARPFAAAARFAGLILVLGLIVLVGPAFGQDDGATDPASAVGAAGATAAAPPANAAYGQTLPAFLVSFVKPILFVLALGAWAWCASKLDKDADFYNFPRQRLGLAQIAVGLLGAAAMLFIPIFWLGFPLGLLILAGGIIGYVVWRNPQVPADSRWTFDLASYRQQYQNKKEARDQRRATLTVFGPGGERVPVPDAQEPDHPYFHQLDELLDFALPRRASLIDMAVDPQQAKYRVEVDGVRYARPAPEPAEAVKFFDYLKRKAGVESDDRRRQQEGKLKVAMEDYGEHKIDLVTAGSTRGMQVRLDIDTGPAATIPLPHLGFENNQLEKLKPILDAKGKAILVTGGPRQGIPTTLYAFLQQHDPYTSSIITLEKDPPHELEGIDHNIIEANAQPPEIKEKLATLLRSDPNAVMVDELYSSDIVKLLADYAAEARLYLPMTEPDTMSALQTWSKAVGKPKLVAEGLGAVIAQKLVRRLCHTCRVPYTPDPAALQKLNLPGNRIGTLYRASGKVLVKDQEEPCPDCHGLGYRGRVGVFEVMTIDGPAAKLIAQGEFDALRLHLRKQKMYYLQEAALAKVVAGTTDIKEVTRVMAK